MSLSGLSWATVYFRPESQAETTGNNPTHRGCSPPPSLWCHSLLPELSPSGRICSVQNAYKFYLKGKQFLTCPSHRSMTKEDEREQVKSNKIFHNENSPSLAKSQIYQTPNTGTAQVWNWTTTAKIVTDFIQRLAFPVINPRRYLRKPSSISTVIFQNILILKLLQRSHCGNLVTCWVCHFHSAELRSLIFVLIFHFKITAHLDIVHALYVTLQSFSS